MAKPRKKRKTLPDLRKHAQMRAYERYGITLNGEQYRRCNEIIQKNCSEPILSQSHTRSWHKIIFEDKLMICVYDRLRHGIVTFLPSDADIAFSGEYVD